MSLTQKGMPTSAGADSPRRGQAASALSAVASSGPSGLPALRPDFRAAEVSRVTAS